MQQQKNKKGMMIFMIVSYALFLSVGVLIATLPVSGTIINKIGICKEISARAYAITIGTMFSALVPTIGYYFATIAPCDFGKKAKIVLALMTTALFAATNAAFFLVINFVTIDGIPVKGYYETDDSWFIPLSMAFASVGMIISYALTLFGINPVAIKDLKMPKGNGKIFYQLLYAFLFFIVLILKFVKLILKFKEKRVDWFILVCTIALTWFSYFVAFIFAIICIALFLGVIILCFAKMVSVSYSLRLPLPPTKQIVISDNGFNRTLTEYDYPCREAGEQSYKDESGKIWYTSDGKTFYQK